MAIRQQSLLHRPGGITMNEPYRVHQEHIRRLKKYLKVIYSQRSGAKDWRIPEHSPVSPGENAGMPLPSQGETPPVSSTVETGEVPPAGERRHKFPIRCRQCGEGYPLLDYYYTKKTGLCIPCWEENVM